MSTLISSLTIRSLTIAAAVGSLAIFLSKSTNSEPAKPAGEVAKKNGDLLHSLKKRRVLAATDYFESELARFEAGVAEVTPERICAALETFVDASIDAAETKEELVAIRSSAVRSTLAWESRLLAAMQVDAASPGDQLPVKHCRIKSQVALTKECIAAGIALPGWPLLPKGSPDGIAAGLIDDLGGAFILDDVSKVSNAGSKELPRISEVILDGKSVDDKTLLALRDLTELSRLSLYDTKATDEGIAALKKHLPQLEILKQNRDSQ